MEDASLPDTDISNSTEDDPKVYGGPLKNPKCDGYLPSAKWDKRFVPHRWNPKGELAFTKPNWSVARDIVASCGCLDPTTMGDQDLVNLIALKQNERPRRKQDCLTDKEGLSRLWSVLGEFGLGSAFHGTSVFLSQFSPVKDAAIFMLKRHFNAPRPYQVFNFVDIDPLFLPGHPRYPSGHATDAFYFFEIIRLVMNGKRPDVLQRFRDMAWDIAFNREVAGVHVRADSEAGRRLAEFVVHFLQTNSQTKQEFAALLDTARQDKWVSRLSLP
jgi:hypothetical protein